MKIQLDLNKMGENKALRLLELLEQFEDENGYECVEISNAINQIGDYLYPTNKEEQEELKRIIDDVISQARENSNEGNWVVYLDEFDEKTKDIISRNSEKLEFLLQHRKEISDVSIDDECIDITIWLKYCYWWEASISLTKKYLMKLYFGNKRNIIFEDYNSFRNEELEDNISNFQNVILKDEDFLLFVYEAYNQYADIEDYIETPLIFGDFHIEFGHTLDEYRGLYGDQYNDGELWDFCLIDIWDKDKSVEANPNMRYWAIVDENGELRVFETYDFEEFEGEE